MKILENQSLIQFNTFKVDAKAKKIVILERSEDYLKLLKQIDFKNNQFFILGDGSNILFTKDYDGTLIKPQLSGISKVKEDTHYVWLKVEAGLNWHKLVLRTIEMGLQGLENLSLIPGTVGAAPVQNIGAYGVEIKQFIEQVTALDLRGGELFYFDAKECEFDYRTSIFKTKYNGRFLIQSVTFRLNKIPEYNTSYEQIKETLKNLGVTTLNAKNISDAIVHIRRNKLPDPSEIGNAGSFFKNPILDRVDYEGLKAEFPGIKVFQIDKENFKISAAWLIESCGWKGQTDGQAGVYHNQPLVLINRGKASGAEILSLSKRIQGEVAKKFGIILQPEVNIL
jgi:UDP-N-acetylmuramate dehydrogenase